MIRKEGYIFIAELVGAEYQPMMGKSINNPGRLFENLASNDITPYDSINQTSRSMRDFGKKFPLKKGTIVQLEMSIAESKEEVDNFSDGDLIVIMTHNTEDKAFLGRKVLGKQDFCNGVGSKLELNGYKTFQYLGEQLKIGTAKYAAKEIHRQAEAPVTIAKFLLRKI